MANIRDNVGRAPLHWAAINGHAEVVDTLLKKKADPHMKAPADNGHTCTPLDLAVEYGHSDVVSLLLRHSGDHIDRGRLLEMAAAGGNTEVMDAISTYGIDTNIPVGDHGSALHSAAFLDHVEVVRWLLRNRANVNMNNAKHGTPPQVAAYEGNLEVIKLLLDHEADPNLGDGVYGNPLNAAAFRDWKDVVLELHRRGANTNAKVGQYGSAINTARMNGHTTMVTLLQSLGAASTGFKVPLRRPSALDEATLYGVSLVENEIKKGRLPAVEKRAKKYIDGLLTAVEVGNKRRLDVILQIGLNLFKAGVKADREGFLFLIVRTAMIILQTAVNRQFQEGIKTMTNLYTTALTFALDQGKPALVERLLYECVKDFNTLIDDGKDADAEDLVNAAIEILFTVVEGGKEQLIEIMAKKWAALFEGLVGGRFGKKALSIIQSYTLRLTSAVEERDTRGVVGWGKTAVEFLSAAISGGHKEVARALSSLFSQTLQSIIDIYSNNSTEWFMNECQRAVSQICTGRLDEKQVTRTWMLGLDFLLATEGGGRQGRDCQKAQTTVLEQSRVFLKAVEDSGLVEVVAETTRTVGYNKINDCRDETHVRILLDDISSVIDAVIGTHRSISLEKSLTRVKEAPVISANFQVSSRWG